MPTVIELPGQVEIEFPDGTESQIPPIMDQFGRYQVGGELGGYEGAFDMVSPISNWERFWSATRTEIQPDLMGGVTAQIRDPYTAAAEAVGLMGLAPDVTDIARAGLVASRPALKSLAGWVEDALGTVGQSTRVSPMRNQMGAIGVNPREFDPRFDPRVKEQGRLQALDVGVSQTGTTDIPEVSIFDLEGRPFVVNMSDRTAAGGQIERINNTTLNDPLTLHGGQDYMFNNPGQIWASEQGPVTEIMNRAGEVAEQTGQRPLMFPWRMAPTGGDHAHMTGEAMIRYASANMDGKTKKALDKAVKEYETVGQMVKGKRVGAGQRIKGWKGVDDPRSIEAWHNAPSQLRKELKDKVFDKKFRNEGGLSIGEARLSVADQSQLTGVDTGLQNVGEIDIYRPLSDTIHPTYGTGIPGEPIGRLREDIMAYELLPNIVHSRGIPDPRNPRATDVRSLMNVRSGIITEDILGAIEMRLREQMRKR